MEDAGELEPALQEELDAHMREASALMNADAPGVMSFSIEDRTEELRESDEALRAPTEALLDAIGDRDAYITATTEAAEVLDEAQALLKKTKGKVDDKDTYKALSGNVKTLEEALEETPDGSSRKALAENTTAIEDASSYISESSPAVSASHEKWKEAKEEAAKRDPANYKSISERDWQLVQRNPDAHKGEKYVVYGAVTQADANMGEISIRVNTGATKQSRRYNYDINTVALVGTADIFSNVVQDDHVKMLVEVGGSMTYDTSIGGSATAVMVLAYDVDVIGQF
ncbi:hypothetical protein GCM10022249_01020 [Enteractinococcus coprophilus]